MAAATPALDIWVEIQASPANIWGNAVSVHLPPEPQLLRLCLNLAAYLRKISQEPLVTHDVMLLLYSLGTDGETASRRGLGCMISGEW